jgi:predicted PurR-regulated permease PerM
LTAVAIILIGAAVTYLGPILKPLLSAVFVYFLIRPAADWLRRRGCPAWLAYLLLFLPASAAITGLLWVLAVNAVGFQHDWPMYKGRLLDLAARWGLQDRVSEGLSTFTPEKLIGFVVTTGAEAAEFGLMLIFYLMFLSLTAARFPDRVRRSYPPERADRILAVGSSVSDGMARYMEVKTAVNAGLALTIGPVLAWYGVDYWLLWAVLAFALNYVTYIGSVAALAPPILLGFLELPLGTAVLLAALLVAIRFIWIDVLEVRLSGRHMNIDSLMLLVFMAYWGWAWGLIGVVLAMPIATCIREGLAAVESTRPIAGLMSED